MNYIRAISRKNGFKLTLNLCSKAPVSPFASQELQKNNATSKDFRKSYIHLMFRFKKLTNYLDFHHVKLGKRPDRAFLK